MSADLSQLRDNMDNLRLDAEEAQVKYLRACGWTNTSSTPGHYWMWIREVPLVLGRKVRHVAFYRADDAVLFQRALTAEAHPRRVEDFDAPAPPSKLVGAGLEAVIEGHVGGGEITFELSRRRSA